MRLVISILEVISQKTKVYKSLFTITEVLENPLGRNMPHCQTKLILIQKSRFWHVITGQTFAINQNYSRGREGEILNEGMRKVRIIT